jgi:hypothetical protein
MAKMTINIEGKIAEVLTRMVLDWYREMYELVRVDHEA